MGDMGMMGGMGGMGLMGMMGDVCFMEVMVVEDVLLNGY